MPKVTIVDPSGREHVLEGELEDSVMHVAVQHGVPGIVGECGGSLSCSTCHVFVSEECLNQSPPIDDFEDEMLDGTAVERRENSRLSCQLVLRADVHLRVTVPDEQ